MAKGIKISNRVLEKIRDKHKVSQEEVYQAFMNRTGPSFLDTREDHKTDPPTLWFVAETDRRRVLKVAYVEHDDHYSIKTAFGPTDGSDKLYETLCQNSP